MSKMKEKAFQESLCELLKMNLPNYRVELGKSLLYKLIIDTNGHLKPKDVSNPKRGNYAFQTDILISKNKINLVAIELKVNRFTTHNILTYSTKALKHKEVYPYLRYGFIIGGIKNINKRFFTHNSGFDFSIAVDDLEKDKMIIIEIVKKQIKSAEKMSEILVTDNLPKSFASYVEIG